MMDLYRVVLMQREGHIKRKEDEDNQPRLLRKLELTSSQWGSWSG